MSLIPTEPTPGRYRHFKGGEYEVLGLVRHSETEEWHILYKSLTHPESGLWIRPLTMWLETVNRDGFSGPRFQRVEDPA